MDIVHQHPGKSEAFKNVARKHGSPHVNQDHLYKRQCVIKMFKFVISVEEKHWFWCVCVCVCVCVCE